VNLDYGVTLFLWLTDTLLDYTQKMSNIIDYGAQFVLRYAESKFWPVPQSVYLGLDVLLGGSNTGKAWFVVSHFSTVNLCTHIESK